MKIGADEVRRVARLAELAVNDADIARLAGELERIVTFVERLDALEVEAGSTEVIVGPERAALRDDRVDPIPMVRGPADIAPAFEQGFFVVPKLGGMGEE